MKIFLTLLVLLTLLEAKESKLGVTHSSALAQGNINKIQVEFKELNNLDFHAFELKYNLMLERAIAEGIMIYKLKENQDIHTLIIKIKDEEKNIKSIKAYKKYSMKIY